jgi:hypothetical protein
MREQMRERGKISEWAGAKYLNEEANEEARENI